MPTYNGYFPATYNYQYPQYQQYPHQVQQQIQQTPQTFQQPQQFQTGNASITWVQGEAAAKSFPTAPGTSVLLMDSENSVFYIKSSDTSGMPLPLRIFDYTERVQQQGPHVPLAQSEAAAPTPAINFEQYITRDEFEKRINQIMESQQVPLPNAAPAKKESTRREKVNG